MNASFFTSEMALTPAERARRYREKKKADAVGREEFLRKEAKRQRDRYTSVADIASERSKRSLRKRWRTNQKFSRTNRNTITEAVNAVGTPPQSPPYAQQHVEPTPARGRGRKRVRKDRAKAYRDMAKLKVTLVSQKRLVEKYKKRYHRLVTTTQETRNTPSSNANRLLRHARRPEGCTEIKRVLIFHNALIMQLRKKYKDSRQKRFQQQIRRVAMGKVLKKYRMIGRAQLALTRGQWAADTAPEDGILDLDRKRRSDALTDDQVETVRSFFQRDDSSRMMPGKRDTVTRRKLKKQKRLLSDSMKTLHAKFRYEHADINICYSTFCTLRPFWVVAPTLADRDTCQCKRHSNIKLMADKLHREGIIPSSSQSEQYNQLVCDKESKTCMYGTCGNCKDNRLPPISHEADCREVTYSQWVTKEKEFTKRSEGEQETRKAKVTVKESREITIGELYLKFETDLKPRFTTHTFNIGHQYRTLRSLKEQMSADEVTVHVDFSENYTCRYGAEIQSVHFGGSHRQASLHTGVYYTTKGTKSFCSISDCTRHDPAGIWAHLQPVLRDIRASDANITTVHFVSDGPTTQYRNKSNFYLASVIPRKLGYAHVTWNFLEASHGKGAADGIGGAVKRQADRFVAEGNDIPDAAAMYRVLLQRTTKVQLYMIEEEEFDAFDTQIPPNLCSVYGTMQIHQVSYITMR